MTPGIVLHGGAGPCRKDAYPAEEALLADLAARAFKAMSEGATALDAACAAVAALEDSGLFIAGRGASPNAAGDYELDAAVMDGSRRTAGAVASLIGYKSPIAAARAVMEHTPHVMLAGAGAAAFAAARALEPVADPSSYFTPSAGSRSVRPEDLAHGTVGAVARDASGGLAAATSTGGVLGKLPGRVGDSPLIGAGTWADERVAVSCTGQGEYFMRAAAAADVSARIRYGGQTLEEAAAGALADMARQGGDGGIIAIDAEGRMVLPFTSHGMKRAWTDAEGRAHAATF